MIGRCVILTLLLLLVLLFLIPLRLTLRYDENGGMVYLRIGPKRIQLYPRQPLKKQKEKTKKEKKQQETEDGGSKPGMLKRIGGNLPLFRALLSLGMEAVDQLLRRLTVSDLNLRLIVAAQGREPAAAAMLYGSGWSAIGVLFPFLQKHFNIKNQQLRVELDPEAAEDRVLASARLHILSGELLFLLAVYACRGLKIYRKGNTAAAGRRSPAVLPEEKNDASQ